MGGFLVTVVVAGLGVAGARLCLSLVRRGRLPNFRVRPWELRVFDCPRLLVCSSPGHARSLSAVVFRPGTEGPSLTWGQVWSQGSEQCCWHADPASRPGASRGRGNPLRKGVCLHFSWQELRDGCRAPRVTTSDSFPA